ncbi:MAG: hypothetical protein IMW83_03835 [Caldanaerobacter subterraneus]|nr:hypothetical protein [Caldanaerobacter subterraneus]
MKRIIYLTAAVFFIFSLMVTGCTKTGKEAQISNTENKTVQHVESSDTNTEEETAKEPENNNTTSCPTCGETNKIQDKVIWGTVIEVAGSTVTVNSSGEKIAVDVKDKGHSIEKGAFVRIEKEGNEIYIDVTKEGSKKEIKEGTDILGILKEAGDNSITVIINGKEETYKVTKETIMQKFSTTEGITMYMKDKLTPGNWIRMLVNKNGEILNIVY